MNGVRIRLMKKFENRKYPTLSSTLLIEQQRGEEIESGKVIRA